MPSTTLSNELLQQTIAAFNTAGSNKSATAGALGISESTVRRRLRTAEQRGLFEDEFEHTKLPSADVPIEDLIADRKQRFKRLMAFEDATKLINVKIKVNGPVGILHMGDPHVDDDGTDIGKLEHDTQIVCRTPGMFAANVGDTTNNWVGRLARLYASQSTSASEAWRIAEWFVGKCRWLYMIGGNHDLWSGSGDPLKWIVKQNDLYQGHAARLNLMFPNGKEIRVNARHQFKGNSMWNQAHGQMRAAQMGFRDHILISGHRHVSGYGVVKDPSSGLVSHCIQVAAYKIVDEYGKALGLPDGNISPSVVTVIDPDAEREEGLVTVFHDVDAGADFLTYLRKKRKV